MLTKFQAFAWSVMRLVLPVYMIFLSKFIEEDNANSANQSKMTYHNHLVCAAGASKYKIKLSSNELMVHQWKDKDVLNATDFRHKLVCRRVYAKDVQIPKNHTSIKWKHPKDN